MNAEKHRLDDLLARLPLPAPDSSAAQSELEREHWAKQLSLTLERVKREQSLAVTPPPTRPDFALDDVLCTPLPIEVGETIPSRMDGNAHSLETQGSFCDVFGNEALDTDPLRAPLKSGEHAPIRLIEQKQPAATAAPSTQRQRSRFSMALVWGGTTTLAAAAILGFYIRAEPNAAPTLQPRVTETPVSAVDKPSEPTSANVAVNVPSTEAAVARAESLAREPETSNPTSSAPKAATRSAAPAQALARIGTVRPAAAPAPRKAAAYAEPALTPAEEANNPVDHPAIGAIHAAFARKKVEAKRCLADTNDNTRVALTFASSGKVTQVVVLNSALDGKTQACLKTVLGTLQVEPFAKKQYVATLSL